MQAVSHRILRQSKYVIGIQVLLFGVHDLKLQVPGGEYQRVCCNLHGLSTCVDGVLDTILASKSTKKLLMAPHNAALASALQPAVQMQRLPQRQSQRSTCYSRPQA